MTDRRIMKRYFDEDKWHPVTIDQVKKWFEKFFMDVDFEFNKLRNGQVVYTDVAEYRMEDK